MAFKCALCRVLKLTPRCARRYAVYLSVLILSGWQRMVVSFPTLVGFWQCRAQGDHVSGVVFCECKSVIKTDEQEYLSTLYLGPCRLPQPLGCTMCHSSMTTATCTTSWHSMLVLRTRMETSTQAKGMMWVYSWYCLTAGPRTAHLRSGSRLCAAPLEVGDHAELCEFCRLQSTLTADVPLAAGAQSSHAG